MRSHMNKKKEGENSNQTAVTKTVTQVITMNLSKSLFYCS